MFGMGPAYAHLIRPEKHLLEMESSEEIRRASAAQQRLARLQEECGTDLDQVQEAWIDVFQRLDDADGSSDGRIDRRALVKWVSALDLQQTIEMEASLNINARELERLVSRADQNKDGFVDKCEFLRLVDNRDRALSVKQQSLLHQYLHVAAYAEEYSCWPPPLFIPCLTILQIAVYLYHVVHFKRHKDHEGTEITWTGPEPVCSRLIYHPSRRYEAWRFTSYCLVHAGIQHILFNMGMQLFVGLPLEASHGFVRVASVYVAGVLAGSLGTSALDPNVFLAGASGGVYALIAAHLATLILNWREDIVIMRRRFRSGKATSAKQGHIVRILRLLSVLLYGLLDTGMAVYYRHVADQTVKTSYLAHICGALAGLLIGIIVLKNRKVEHWETKLKVICVVVFVLLAVTAVLWNIFGDFICRLTTGKYYFSRDEDVPMQWETDETCHNYI